MAMITSLFRNRNNSIFNDPFYIDFPFSPFSSSFTSWRPETAAIANQRIDWKETPEAHIAKAGIPEMKSEEVNVEMEDDKMLQISGERNHDTWHRVERSSGKFVRKCRLPENVKMDQVKASMEDGVLIITIPKEVEKADLKFVEISG